MPLIPPINAISQMTGFAPELSSPRNFALGNARLLFSVLCVLSLALAAPTSPVEAQETKRADDTFYMKLGAGFSDYTGDFPIQNTGHAFDFQEFQTGDGFPFLFTGEFGYQFSHKWGLALGFQGGDYPLVGRGGRRVEDTYRYTPQLLARYTFADANQTVAPYIDGGANATFGGDASTDPGFGPTFGVGVDFALNQSTQLFVESRFNLTFPDDAIDGRKNIEDTDVSNNPNISEAQGSILGGSDSVNQLLGFGVKYNFTRVGVWRWSARDRRIPHPHLRGARGVHRSPDCLQRGRGGCPHDGRAGQPHASGGVHDDKRDEFGLFRPQLQHAVRGSGEQPPGKCRRAVEVSQPERSGRGLCAPGERNPDALSEDRAQAVADFYERNGIAGRRIETSGQGKGQGEVSKKGETQQYRRADSIPRRGGDR